MMLNWEEICLLNKKMSTYSFLKMLQDQNIYPSFVEKSYLEDSFQKIIPSVGSKESSFYNNKLAVIFEKDLGAKRLAPVNSPDHEGDPQISFYEFYLLLGKIGLDNTMKEH